MSRPVKNARCHTTPGGPKAAKPKEKVGKPDMHSGRERLGKGEFLDRGTPMFEGPPKIMKDNRS